jgi:L-asparaginase
MLVRKIDILNNEKIVITHGTDTIHLTAKRLVFLKGKTIVVTGAMLPEKFYSSDAHFNLGMAVATVQIAKPGVYIALYGRVVPWDKYKAPAM